MQREIERGRENGGKQIQKNKEEEGEKERLTLKWEERGEEGLH